MVSASVGEISYPAAHCCMAAKDAPGGAMKPGNPVVCIGGGGERSRRGARVRKWKVPAGGTGKPVGPGPTGLALVCGVVG